MGVLFRLFELEQGRVLLGGVDIARMGVAMLRRQITIVPQDPILFSGELRKNLDPLCAKQDSELWLALRRCGLAELTEGLEGQLSAVVHEGGTNFSVGERQVICLARALLRDAHVLCLDEATANVDPISDKRIQQVLSKEISQCIVLTIAHRLRTVLNSDRILVLDTGKVAQLDTPTALLENPGIFHDLATQAGISTQDITEARCTGIVQAASVSSQNQEEASTVVSI
jgi:ABC-type multidrug transport system fused ATPase/permease subunit